MRRSGRRHSARDFRRGNPFEQCRNRCHVIALTQDRNFVPRNAGIVAQVCRQRRNLAFAEIGTGSHIEPRIGEATQVLRKPWHVAPHGRKLVAREQPLEALSPNLFGEEIAVLCDQIIYLIGFETAFNEAVTDHVLAARR